MWIELSRSWRLGGLVADRVQGVGLKEGGVPTGGLTGADAEMHVERDERKELEPVQCRPPKSDGGRTTNEMTAAPSCFLFLAS